MESADMTPQMSPSVGKLAKALAAAQAEMSNATKDSINPHFKTKYADLASVREAVIPALAKQQISCTQLNEPFGPDGVLIVTLLMHESGEWVRSRTYIPVTQKTPQGFGAAITYGRRFALASIAMVAQEDDDGNSTQMAKRETTKPSEPSTDKPGAEAARLAFILRISEAEDAETLAIIRTDVQKAGLSDKDRDIVRKAWTERAEKVGK